MEVIKTFITSILTFLKSKLLAAWELFELLLYKIFGKDRVKNAKSYLLNAQKNIRQRLYGHLNPEGKYYGTLKTLYKWSYNLGFAVIFYIFLIKTNFLWLTGGMPSIEQLQNPKLSQASTIYYADGEIMGKFFTENRSPVDSSAISPWVFKALIATEDKRFNEHSGIDLKRMAGVAKGILTGNSDSGGGSTISQQLAKNLYNTRKKEMRGLLYYIPFVKTIVYKTKEWLTAIELEKRFTKGEIATLYLNTVDYGNNAYGIKTAAKTYFNKTPQELDVSEASVLVGLQKATTFYNPIRNPKNSKKRRNTVFQRLVQNGDLDAKTAEKLSEKDIKLDVNIEDAYDGQGNYFKGTLAKFIENWSEKNDLGIDLYRDGLKIYTTVDSKMQTYAESAVKQHMKMLQKEFNSHWKDKKPWTYENGDEIPNFIETVAKREKIYKQLATKYNNNQDSIDFYMNKPVQMNVFSWEGNKKMMMSPMDSIRYYKKFLQAGMMAYDPYSGFIKAWVGGIDFEHFKYDHVKQGRRQPGSAFKPIVYTAAIDGPLNLSPCDRREDKEIELKWMENGEEKVYKPKNANGSFSNSNMTLRTAIARSVNSVAVQLTNEIKPSKVVEYAKKMGITSKLDPVVSLGLGSSDVSLYEMIAAYGIFLNEGMYREPIFVFKIEDASGKVLYEFEPKTHEAIKPESAFLMQYMLRGNVEEPGGTGARMFNYSELFKNGGQVAGKTGTTSNNSDAWYVGFTKDLVGGVWVGGDDRSIHFRGGLGEGSKSALPIFGIFMNKVYGDKSLGYSPGPFPKPSIKIEKDYLSCFSYAKADTTAVDSLSQSATLDSVERYRNRFNSDSSINLEKLNSRRARPDSL
ncbi:MAG TPA: transglycosylase domain-containing protein [Leadbetterella sp.]|nr:transglycosylase domain-containing protein [Leadbetterella sp.]